MYLVLRLLHSVYCTDVKLLSITEHFVAPSRVYKIDGINKQLSKFPETSPIYILPKFATPSLIQSLDALYDVTAITRKRSCLSLSVIRRVHH